MDLVGIDEKFDLGMLPHRGQGVGMKGKYSYPDLHKQDAKEFLTEFYSRPNQELYRLLDEVNAGPYTPFESSASSTFLNNESRKDAVYQDRSILVRSGIIINSPVANMPVSELVLCSLSMTIFVVVIAWYLVSNRNR